MWEAFLVEQLRKIRFVRGLASPCRYKRRTRDLRCIIYRDDLVFVGPEEAVDLAEKQLKPCFLVKILRRLGGDS